MPPLPQAIAFQDRKRIAAGDLPAVAREVKRRMEAAPDVPILVFDGCTGRAIDLDLRGSLDEVEARAADRALETGQPGDAQPQDGRPGEGAAPDAPRGAGRPRLGVVAREVTLLPRHWEWLRRQPGGASATLRRLVDAARRAESDTRSAREAREAAYRFMTELAGDEPGYEEAVRALFAGDGARLAVETARWPADVRAHALALAGPGLDGAAASA